MAVQEQRRRLTVVKHAVEQLQTRRRDERSTEEVRQWIEDEVREAIEAGRVQERKPKPFRLYREPRKGRLWHPRDRCVWTEDETTAWIVRRHDAEDVVLTSLVRTNS